MSSVKASIFRYLCGFPNSALFAVHKYRHTCVPAEHAMGTLRFAHPTLFGKSVSQALLVGFGKPTKTACLGRRDNADRFDGAAVSRTRYVES